GTGGSYTFINVTGDHTISASFAINTYTITASSGANGTVTPAGTSNANCGSTPGYTITPAANYHIVDVLVDGSSVGAVGAYIFTAVSANHTISASFAPNSFTITSSSDANSTISPSGATNVLANADQTFTI